MLSLDADIPADMFPYLSDETSFNEFISHVMTKAHIFDNHDNAQIFLNRYRRPILYQQLEFFVC